MAKSLRYYHVILGGFLLPIALVFFITGGLLAVDVKGSKKTTDWTYHQKDAYISEVDTLTRRVINQALDRGISLSLESIPRVNNSKGLSRTITWKNESSSVRVIIMQETPDAVVITVKKNTFFGSFIGLHKVKHGFLYKVYIVISSIALIILTITGFLMLLKDKVHRRLGLLSAIVGSVIFYLLIAF